VKEYMNHNKIITKELQQIPTFLIIPHTRPSIFVGWIKRRLDKALEL
jgi:hypothetical protein